MGEVAGQYDAVIVNFYDGSQDNYQLIDEAFRESIGVFRAKLIERISKRQERQRSVLFAECDISNPDNEQFLLDTENIEYPNIVMLLRNVVVAFDMIDEQTQTLTQMVEILSSEFLEQTNFWILQLTCNQLRDAIQSEYNIVLYVGDYKNLGEEAPMEFFVQAYIMSKSMFSHMRYLFLNIDLAQEAKCRGMFDIPNEHTDALLMFHGKERDPAVRIISE